MVAGWCQGGRCTGIGHGHGHEHERPKEARRPRHRRNWRQCTRSRSGAAECVANGARSRGPGPLTSPAGVLGLDAGLQRGNTPPRPRPSPARPRCDAASACSLEDARWRGQDRRAMRTPMACCDGDGDGDGECDRASAEQLHLSVVPVAASIRICSRVSQARS
jgi:hypothetical protein